MLVNILKSILALSFLAGVTSFASGGEPNEQTPIRGISGPNIEEYMAEKEKALKAAFPFIQIKRSGFAIEMIIPPANFERGATELVGLELANTKALAALLQEYKNTGLSLRSQVSPEEAKNRAALDKARIGFIRSLLINGGVVESRFSDLSTDSAPAQSAQKDGAKGYVEVIILPAKASL